MTNPLQRCSLVIRYHFLDLRNKMTAIELVSDRLFGRKSRLVLAAWIRGLSDGTFYQQQAASETGIPQSNVRDELKARLIPLGMVQELPRTAGDRRQYYSRTNSDLWRIIESAVEIVSAPPRTAALRRRTT